MIKDLLLPREKFADIRSLYGLSPFTFEIENEEQVLFYFGANHSKDSANPQYVMLREYWKRFLSVTENRERIVLVEGGSRHVEKDEETAIRRGCEAGFITLLASRENVVATSPDLSLEELAEKFPDISKEEVLLLRFIDRADSFQRNKSQELFEDIIEAWFKDLRRLDMWKDIETTLPNLKEIYKKVIGRDFDLQESMNNLANPNRTGTRINEISSVLTDARDVNIVSVIEGYWKEGMSVFAVFGSGHLVIQRPALEKLLV